MFPAPAGIFDGHGGKEAAEFCRQNLHRHVARALELVKPPGTPERLHQGDAGSIDDERLYANEVLENAAAAVTQAYVQADAAFLASTGGDDDEMPEFLKPRAGATCCSVLVNLFTLVSADLAALPPSPASIPPHSHFFPCCSA